jgi:hypothetical protein
VGKTNEAMHEALEVADALFGQHHAEFGPGLAGYRGHVCRVIELTAKQVPLDPTSAKLLGIAAFFHDAGIWMDDTFDYLPPSIERATGHLRDLGYDQPADAELVRAIIHEHHRQRRAIHDNPLVEAFRRADLADVSLGIVACPDTSRAEYRSLLEHYPSHGFRRGLVVVAAKWTARHPLNPFPMIKI